jgi:hypothetical protein
MHLSSVEKSYDEKRVRLRIPDKICRVTWLSPLPDINCNVIWLRSINKVTYTEGGRKKFVLFQQSLDYVRMCIWRQFLPRYIQSMNYRYHVLFG